MSLKSIIRTTERLARDNSPAILTGIGVAGTLTTAYLTGKASFKAAQVLMEVQVNDPSFNDSRIDLQDATKIVWKLYIPAAGVGVGTITAIIFANRIGTRRAAAMAAAYTISEKAFTEYREKIVEKIGETKEKAARDEIAQDRVNRAAEDGRQIVVVSDSGQVMCHDAFSNQFFHSDMESLRKAVNDVNQQILHSDFATISDFYHFVGSADLQETSVSGEMGWNTDKFLEVDFTTVMYLEKTRCITVNFVNVPIPQPWRFC